MCKTLTNERKLMLKRANSAEKQKENMTADGLINDRKIVIHLQATLANSIGTLQRV